MRILVLIAIILLSVELISAKTTLIGGHFDNPKDSTVTIQYYSTILSDIENNLTKQEVVLDEKNNFLFEIETDIPLTFNLLNGSNWLFINKYAAIGDSVYFKFKDSSMEFTSKCEECLNFMFEWEEKFLSNPKVNKEFNSSFASLEPIQFSDYWFKRKNDQLEFFNSYFKDKNYTEDFKEYMEAEINYSFMVSMLQYSFKNKNGKEAFINSEYIKFLDLVKLNNPKALVSRGYLQFLRELPYTLYQVTVDYKDKENKDNLYRMYNQQKLRDSIGKIYFSNEVYDYSLYYILDELTGYLESDKGSENYPKYVHNIDSALKLYSTSFNNSKFYNRIIDKFKTITSDNKLAPDFKLLDLNGKEVKLSDFLGKVVYLDFWGTNCAPCVAEIPAAKQLKERFKDKDVVFLYIAFDNSVDKLKRFIDSKSFKGVHLIEKKGFASNVADVYKINSIPQYFLIDKKGYIVNSNAPRPSNKPDQIIENELKK